MPMFGNHKLLSTLHATVSSWSPLPPAKPAGLLQCSRTLSTFCILSINLDPRTRSNSSAMEKKSMKKDEHLQALFFTAGVAVLAACIQRAAIEQWRTWVFLALNLLLVAVLFTSTKPTKPTGDHNREEVEEGVVDDGKLEQGRSEDRVLVSKEEKKKKRSVSSNTPVRKKEKIVEEEDVKGLMSEEELEERAEAFIAMFRQQLISDRRRAAASNNNSLQSSSSTN